MARAIAGLQLGHKEAGEGKKEGLRSSFWTGFDPTLPRFSLGFLLSQIDEGERVLLLGCEDPPGSMERAIQ